MSILSKVSMSLIGLCTVANLAFAAALDTPDRAMAVQARLEKVVLGIKDVNGIGIAGCDPRTGKENSASGGNFVHCVLINTATRAAYQRVSQMYPTGTRVNGVFVAVEYIGVIDPQPRSSAGN